MNLVDMALTHAQSHDAVAYLLAMTAGAATSIGPCVAPRYVAIAAIAGSGGRRRFLRLFSFLSGTIAIYFAIASAGAFVVRLAQASSLIYWLLAIALIVSGFIALRPSGHSCACDTNPASSVGAAFFFGVGTSTAISPCCTPILLALGALGSATTNSVAVAGLVTAYTIGHLAPVAALYSITGAAKRLMTAHQETAIVVCSGVTIALGIYYAVLA